MTEEEWEKYIINFCSECSPDQSYSFSENNTRYSVDLFKLAYLEAWTSICLWDMNFPEKYQGPTGLFKSY